MCWEQNKMRIYLISAYLFLASVASTYSANIQRNARNTEAIIPTIVEEILKVELQSDLKKNNAIEATEDVPIIKTIEEQIIVEPGATRTIAGEISSFDEKTPKMTEIVAIKEVVPEPVQAILKTQPLPKIDENSETLALVENLEKPVENFRIAELLPVEQPMAEIVKEVRKDPTLEVVTKEEEIVKPMVRNVIKEEIPQIEELRNINEEIFAIKEVLPEPLAASNIVEPVVEILSQPKTIISEPVMKEVKKENPEISSPSLFEVKSEPEDSVIVTEDAVNTKVEKPVESAIKNGNVQAPLAINVKIETKPDLEIKSVPENAPLIEESDPQIRQSERQTIVEQVQSVIANVPIVGQFFNRNPAVVATSDETVSDETISTPSPGAFQQFISGAQQVFTNTINSLNPATNNAASNQEGSSPAQAGPIVQAAQAAQSAFQSVLSNVATNVANIVNRPSNTQTAQASDEKPTAVDEKPVKVDEIETVKQEPVLVADFEVKKETPKLAQEEKENLVKN